jgi:VWFA-related protein
MRRALFAGLMGIALAAGSTGVAQQPPAKQPPTQPPIHPATQVPPPSVPDATSEPSDVRDLPTWPNNPSSAQDPPNQPNAPNQPTFRVGATFVRVDAFITKNGEPVGDLTRDDFLIKEDGVPQTIRTFEYVNIPPGNLQTGERKDPNTVAESRAQAADPRKRVFVLFLDTYHITQGAGMSSRQALLKFLQRMIGPDDLIAGMTPEMSPDGISFSSRTQSLEAVLQGIYGRRDALRQDEEEEEMQTCFTREEWQQVRERRRAKLTLDALEALVHHIDGLREERKAIITVTEGWPLFRDDMKLIERPDGRMPTGPGIVRGRPGGRPGTDDPRIGHGMTRGECDAARLKVGSYETWQQFRDLPDLANRANASFYTVDPRGLAAFDAPLDAATQPLPPAVDQAILRNKLENLRELAERTDGLAVQNTNDLSGALNRIARDLSAYYLIGYDSTNSKLDGTFRAIQVQLKRPGLVVRARKGYRAALDGTASASTRNRGGRGAGATATDSGSGNGGGASTAPENPGANDVANAVSSLTATRADLPIRLRVASVRMPAAAPANSEGAPAAAEVRELRVLAELDPKTAASPFWQQGGTAHIVVRDVDGSSIASSDAELKLGERTVIATLPLSAQVKPGEYRVQVRLTTASKTDSVGDTVAVTVPARAMSIGEPAVLRRGPSTGLAYVPTADLRFRRQERLRLEAPLVAPFDRVKATVVDQRGQAMQLPVHLTDRSDAAARIVVVDVSLAPLAAGGYAVILSDTDAATATRIIVPVQIIP